MDTTPSWPFLHSSPDQACPNSGTQSKSWLFEDNYNFQSLLRLASRALVVILCRTFHLGSSFYYCCPFSFFPFLCMRANMLSKSRMKFCSFELYRGRWVSSITKLPTYFRLLLDRGVKRVNLGVLSESLDEIDAPLCLL